MYIERHPYILPRLFLEHRQRIPLWQFLFHLLNRDKTSRYIEWNRDRVLEFRIKDTMAVADLWGSVKNKTDMTYEKLGRAMRYYYGKNIIEKVKNYYHFLIEGNHLSLVQTSENIAVILVNSR